MNIKKIANIEESFFDIDEKARVAAIELEFGSPDDIFDNTYVSKIPVLSDDFIAWIGGAFRLVSDKYRIALTVRFDDMGGYTEKELAEIFYKNIDLEFKSRFVENRGKNRIAYGLIAIGIAFFLVMMLVNRLWESDSVWKDIFVYVSDIATTVAFWEAITILVVQQKEKLDYLKNLKSRFASIKFAGKPRSATDV